jgi:hypothetical protein
MFYFSYTMALFWVFAELFIIAYVLKGFSFLVQDGKKHYGFIIFASVFFILLIFATFFRDQIYSLFPDLPNTMQKKFYGYALWHFYCSQWLVFEACITLYILRVYALMKQSNNQSKKMTKKWKSIERFTVYAVPGFLVLCALFYLGYEFLTFSAMQNNLIDRPQLYHIYLFYVKICGIFWVLVDGAAAFLGYKIFRFLKIN